jgi:hypothetical protein
MHTGIHQTISRRHCGMIIAVIGLFVPSLVQVVSAESNNAVVYSLDAKPFGLPYGIWAAHWQKWMAEIPTPDNPTIDTTGKNCGLNQSGPVWFLTGTTGGSAERSCTIPAGKAIFFPVMGSECSYAENPIVKSERDLAICAQADDNIATNLQASIDGKSILQLEKYRVTSPLFNLTFPTTNIFGSPAGPTKSIVDGFFVFLQPLTSGKHELHFSGLTPGDPTTGTANFAVDVTYHLLVK